MVRSIFFLLTFLAEPALASPAAVELRPLPEVETSRMEEAVRGQLAAAHGALAAVLAEPGASPEARGLAYGELGRLALAFGLDDLAEAALENARSLDPSRFEWHYYLGLHHQQDRRLDRASEALERCLELRPEDLPATLRLAQVARLSGDGARAEQLFRRLEERASPDPVPAAVHYGLGRVAAAAGEHRRAVERFRLALEEQPEAREVRQQLGLAYRALGELERAREHLGYPAESKLSFEDPLADALAALRSRGHVFRGMLAVQEGRLEEAEEQYRAVVGAEPDNPSYRRALASVLHRRGRLAAAAEQYAEAALLDPADAVARLRWADVLLELGREEALAVEQLRRAVEIAPDSREARLALGKVLARRGGLQEASVHLRAARELRPDDMETRLRLGRILLDLGRVEAGTAELEAALELEPENAAALLALGRARGESGRGEEALALLVRASELAEDRGLRALAEYRIGLALAAAGRLPEAVGHLERALELRPENPAAYLALERAFLAQGRWLEAAEALRRGREHLPEEPELAHRLALLLATAPDPEIRDGEAAVRLVETALDLDASFERAETRGMALAAAGRLEEAVDWQLLLLENAERAGAPDPVLARLRRNLERYRSGDPALAPDQVLRRERP